MKFWEHVRKGDGCWMWTGGTNAQGYGRINHSHNKKTLAHRAAWELVHGPVPAGLCVLHRCDTPACVNPEHLWLGTRTDNGRDRNAKGRTISRRGELAGRAVLTREMVLEARRLHAGGEPYAWIAERFGVAPTTIRSAITGRTWGWLHASDEQARKAVERL